jgi:uncharacterized protein YqjF (DUF2071 family)
MSPDWNAVRAAEHHRPFPAPTSPWLMTMSWCDLCFLHWSVNVDDLGGDGREMQPVASRHWQARSGRPRRRDVAASSTRAMVIAP